MRRIFFPMILMLVFTACSKPGPKTTLADKHKSCDALVYEYKELTANGSEVSEPRLSGTDYFHRGVVVTGVAVSLTPVNLSSIYFYLLPVMTIWYYNLFIESDQDMKAAERQKERRKTLEILLKQKQCNEETN